MGIKEQYDEIVLARKEIIEQIKILADDETVKKYLELCKSNDQLSNKQRDLYSQLKTEEYSSCNHIWVNTLHDYDRWEGRSYNYYGCIKCGLDQRVFYLMENRNDLRWLSMDQQIMYNFMKNRTYDGDGIVTKVLCDLDLAKAIYSKIKEAHPDIDDETARKYFEIALDDIREIKVSEERKANRAKRLSLETKFNKWTGWDIRSN